MENQHQPPAESPHETTHTEKFADVWVELKRGPDGVSLTAYRKHEDGHVDVVDEAWWTWPEFTGIETMDLPISLSAVTTIESVPASDAADE